MNEKTNLPAPGLYQHFKGNYYFLMNLLRDSVQDCKGFVCQYFNVLHPEMGYFSRPVEQWYTDVSERKDNVTGQKTRFQKVVSLDLSMSNFTTEQLLNQLSIRPDSPLQELDLPGLSACVSARDYVVGQTCNDGDGNYGVHTTVAFTTEAEAKEYFATHRFPTNTYGVFKRTFLRVD